ncbi:porin [Pacificibacter sp.]|uniref:porin n=1 Tax=Pacificibacter sp. TaxID=1917866 RepID=UPI0032199DB9
MKKFLFVLANVTAVSAAPQIAHATFLNTSLSYSHISEDGADANSVTGKYMYERNFGNISVSGGIVGSKLSSDGFDSRSNEYSAAIGISINPALTVFGGVSSFDIDGDFEIDQFLTYSLGAEYLIDEFTIGAAVLNSDSTEMDLDATQIYVDYNTPKTKAYASVSFVGDENIIQLGAARDTAQYEAKVDALRFDEIGIYSAAFSYNIQPRTRLNVGLEHWNVDGDKLNKASIGGGYMVVDNIWFDVGYQNYDADGASADGVSLKISYDLGTGRLRAIDRIQTYSFLNPNSFFVN